MAGRGPVTDGLFDAQTELVLDRPATPRPRTSRAPARAYAGDLRDTLREADPAADEAIAGGLQRRRAGRRAATTRRRSPPPAAPSAPGSSAAPTRSPPRPTARGDAATAKRWLLLREYRTATRFTRPGAQRDARARPARARQAHADGRRARPSSKDLLDAYQARLRELLADARRGIEQDLPARRAEAAAQAAGYFAILAPRYAEDRGAAAEEQASAAFAALPEAGDDLAAALDAAEKALEGFTAAPFTPEEAARRAQQLLQFLALVPVEYGRGVKGDQRHARLRDHRGGRVPHRRRRRVRRPARPARQARPGPHRDAARRRSTELGRLVEVAQQAASEGVAEPRAGRAGRRPGRRPRCTAAMPKAWTEKTDESDYDLIGLTLDRMEAAAGAGQYRQAEQARLEAYAFFEFGPERRLRSLRPGSRARHRGPDLVRRRRPGRPRQADRQARAAARDPRDAARARHQARRRRRDARRLRQQGHGRHQLGDHRLPRGPGGRADPRRHHGLDGRPAPAAAAAGVRRRARRAGRLVVTWVLAQTLLQSLERYGEKLEAVVGLVAIGVLLLITNWFFHKVYWSEWIAKFHRQRKRYEKLEKRGLHLRAGDRAVRARADQRLPRGLRDRALPAVAAALAPAPRPCSRAPGSAWR